MSEPKKWITLTATGAAITALVARWRHRGDQASPPAKPAATSTPAPATSAAATAPGPATGAPKTPR